MKSNYKAWLKKLNSQFLLFWNQYFLLQWLYTLLSTMYFGAQTLTSVLYFKRELLTQPDPELSSVAQNTMLIIPRYWFWSPYWPFTLEELDLMILLGPFQHRLLCDSVNYRTDSLEFYSPKSKKQSYRNLSWCHQIPCKQQDEWYAYPYPFTCPMKIWMQEGFHYFDTENTTDLTSGSSK